MISIEMTLISQFHASYTSTNTETAIMKQVYSNGYKNFIKYISFFFKYKYFKFRFDGELI